MSLPHITEPLEVAARLLSRALAAPAMFLLTVAPITFADVTEPHVEKAESSTSQAQAADTEQATEEMVVVGERRTQPYVLMDPVTLSRTRNDAGKGARLYRQKRYREAYPYLLSAAQAGFKMSQARVSYIYQKGLGGVDRNGVAAIGWLGVAASGVTSPEIRNYYKAAMNNVPDDRLETVEKIVAAYTAEFGSDKTGITCANERQAGTHISRMKCDHKDEWRRDDIDIDGISEGIGGSVGTGGLFGVTDIPPVGSP
jgi:hypothetical protein